MPNVIAELAGLENTKDLKTLLASRGPCLSFYMRLSSAPPNQAAKANALEWREIVRSVAPKLQRHGSQASELLEQLSDWNEIIQRSEPQDKSVAVFRSPEVFHVSWFGESVRARAVVGPHFYIRPLLPELTRAKTFYILALSQKNVRLLRCTLRTSEEVPFPSGIITGYEAYMNTAKPDHVSDNRSIPGPSAGSSKGIFFGTSSDRDDKDEYLAHFYRHIDRGVNEVLRNRTEPLILAGVEPGLSVYRSLNKYPRLADEWVEGAPNGLKAGEMHARAIDALLRCYDKRVDEALAEYNHKVGGGASNRLKEIIPAAHDGRVLTLLVSDSLETTGAFDESTHKVTGRETGAIDDEDLVNDAVVQAILHAGQVYVVPNGKMPNGAPLAAVYRF